VKHCINCGYRWVDDEEFCGYCGNALSEEQQGFSASPAKYTASQPSIYSPNTVQKTSSWKFWLITIEVLLGVFLLVCYCMLPYEMKKTDLNTLPEQTAQVDVVKMEHHRSRKGPGSYHAYFMFEDGTEKNFEIPWEYYRIIWEGETGTLFYKERSNKGNVDNRLFIRFEKDES